MVLKLDGNSLHVAHASRKIDKNIRFVPALEKAYTGQITEIASYVRTYL